jgi:Bacterial mobilisation protein (MobC)./Ribbon-helix-helix protein, copG family.
MKENKTTRIPVKISYTEKNEIRDRAQKLGMTVSAYMRTAALKQKIIIRTDKEMVRQVKYIGNNVNQIAHQYNMRGENLDGIAIVDAYTQMEEYKQLLQLIMDKIEKK